jgi:predicted nucleotidyltransferase
MSRDIDTIVEIIKDFGGKEAYLFGSVARGDNTDISDIDVGVKGVPKNSFFKLCGKIMMELNRKVDIVDLDEETRFSKRLFENEVFARVL